MSDKPRIWANCNSGCKWETIHKDDFLAVAPLIKQPIKDDRCYLETGKQYKIFADKTEAGFSCSIKLAYTNNETEATYDFSIPNDDKYADSVVFRLLETSISGSIITIVYEIAGIRYTEELSGTSIVDLYVDNANNVFLFNTDATYKVEGEDGKSVFVRYATSLSGENMSATYTGQSYMGVYTGKVASGNPSDYTWVFLGTLEAEGIEAVIYAESERQKSKNLSNGKFKVGCYRFADGIYDAYNTDYICTDFISVKPNETITFSYKGIDWTDSSGFVFFNNGVYISTSRTLTAVVPDEANQVAYNIFGVGIANNISSVLEPQLEYGSVATEYKQYNGAILHEKQGEKVSNKVITIQDTYTILSEERLNKYPSLEVVNQYARGKDNFVDDAFTSVDNVLTWIKNSAPQGAFTKYINVNGDVWCYLILKASSSYATVVAFNYGDQTIRKITCNAGEWQGWVTIS